MSDPSGSEDTLASPRIGFGMEWRPARDKVFLVVMLVAVGVTVASILPHYADSTQDLVHDARNLRHRG